MIMFGVAFGGAIEHLPVIVINADSDAHVVINQTIGPFGPFGPFNFTVFNESVSSLGDKIVEYLDESSSVDIDTSFDEIELAKQSVDDKKFIAAIMIPEDFTWNLASPFGENLSIQLYIDNSQPQVGVVVLQTLQEAFQDAAGEFRGNLGLDVSYSSGEGLNTIDFFAPSMIALGVFFFSFILIIMNLIGERKGGTLPLLLQCPYDKLQIILGYLCAFSVVSMVQTTVIIVAANVVFGVTFGSSFANYISIYIAAVILGWTGLVLAIFLSSFAHSEFQAVQFIPLVILPALMLSGIIIPIDQIPEIFRWVSYIFPTTYAVQLLRRIAIDGDILSLFDVEIIMQALFFVIFLFGSRLTLKET
jgi:ABC transporter DrrB family efflux protein